MKAKNKKGDKCQHCIVNDVAIVGKNKDGFTKYSYLCYQCRKKAYGYDERTVYTQHKEKSCVQCGFIGHSCQLDVDHIDGDHENNDPDNLQTLCANCHRLKTFNQIRQLKKRPLVL